MVKFTDQSTKRYYLKHKLQTGFFVYLNPDCKIIFIQTNAFTDPTQIDSKVLHLVKAMDMKMMTTEVTDGESSHK